MFHKDKQYLPFLQVSLTLGIFCAITMLLLSILGLAGISPEGVELIGTYYLGYDLSFLGIILGLIYGFIDGFICGAIFVWLYNQVGGILK